MNRKQPKSKLFASTFIKDELEVIQNAFEEAPIIMCVLEGFEHRIIYMNKSFRQLIGNRSIPVGLPSSELFKLLKVPEELAKSRLELLDNIYRTKEPFIINEMKSIYDRQGNGQLEDAWFNVIYQPIEDNMGDTLGIFFNGFEITDYVRAREQITYDEQRLALALNGTKMGMWEVDVNNRTLDFVTDYTKAHFGISQDEEFSYERFLNSIHPEDRTSLRKIADDALNSNEGYYEITYRVIWPDGTVHWLLSRGQWLFDENGKPDRQIGVTMEITSIKEIQNQLEEAVKLRDQFLSIASHELQTPVTSIKARAELFERKLNFEGQPEFAKQAGRIKGSVDQISNLTASLLDISQVPKGRLRLEKANFYLCELISETVDTLQHISHHKIEIEGVKAKEIYADRFRIGQVLTNILSNAIKYSPEGDKVVLRFIEEDNRVVISVTDNGIGISDRDKKNIFKRFYKGSNNQNETFPGFGIGLYISQQIIQSHRGSIWVEDNPSGGSVFFFTIPDSTAQ